MLVFDEELGVKVCDHAEAYLDPACCDGAPDEGRMTCGCEGRDAVICSAADCTGIEDWQTDDLLDELTPIE